MRVVAFDAIVRDRSGALVHGLTRNDFTLLEDGHPQPLRYFSEDNDLPLTIGLLVDTSGSQRPYFAEERAAGTMFLTNMLTRPKDAAFVARFDESSSVLQAMSTDLASLEGALSRLTTLSSKPDPGTHLFDALCTTSTTAFGTSSHSGHRALVLFTDGEDSGSTHTRDQAIECAQRADVMVYTALYSSREPIQDDRFDPHVAVFPHEHLPGRTNMERISRSTGGRVFVVSKSLPIEQIFATIQQELRRQYRIGYTPSGSSGSGYHRLELKPHDRRYRVQTRTGYYAPK